jgi:uncharacterized protein (TIGR01777 family)
MTAVLAMLTLQCVLGGFDNLWHHEITEKLPLKPAARRELALHTVREFLYAMIFTTIAWARWQGLWTFILIAVLAIEIAVTLGDFIVEDRTRQLPWLERVLHTVLAINFGAILAIWWPELRQWMAAPTGFTAVGYGIWSWALTLFGVGVFAWGWRDLAAVIRLGVPNWQRRPVRARHAAAARGVLVTGATGFIGRALTRALIKRGDRVVVLTRDAAKAADLFGPHVETCVNLMAIEPDRRIDVIVNLAGEPLLGGLWTRARKRRFLDSRLGITQGLVTLISRLQHKPEVLITGSAVGYYGDRGDDLLSEDQPAQPMFMSELCRSWEAAAQRAEIYGVRVCCLRIGLVLGHDGGALPPLTLATRLGLGAVLGGGRQFVSWIHLRDLVRLILAAVDDTKLSGPVNAVTPNPVMQRDFARALADHWRRPLLLRITGRLVRAALGELSDLFLTSQRVAPAAATIAGFNFEHSELAKAIAMIFAPPQGALPPLSVYYDEPCPVCRSEMAHYRAAAERAGCAVQFKPIGASTYDAVSYRLSDADLRRRLYLIDREGQMVSGVDAFLALWNALPGFRWGARLVRLPVVYQFADLVYEGICVPALAIMNRHRLRRPRFSKRRPEQTIKHRLE